MVLRSPRSKVDAIKTVKIDSDLAAELVDVAHALADAARPITLEYFRRSELAVDTKAQSYWDPVTLADRQVEQAMRDILAQRRPNDGILGEEFDDHDGESGLLWVLDPIDGTRGFVSGTPSWGVLIALSDAQGPQFGVIDQPYIGERFVGGFGLASVTGPGGKAALSVRGGRGLSEASLFSTTPEIGTAAEKHAFDLLAKQVRMARFGLDCYAYALLAAGHIDLVVEAGLQPFDIHAPAAIVQAAGGVVTDWDGYPCHGGGRVIAAASAELHAAALQFLGGV